MKNNNEHNNYDDQEDFDDFFAFDYPFERQTDLSDVPLHIADYLTHLELSKNSNFQEFVCLTMMDNSKYIGIVIDYNYFTSVIHLAIVNESLYKSINGESIYKIYIMTFNATNLCSIELFKHSDPVTLKMFELAKIDPNSSINNFLAAKKKINEQIKASLPKQQGKNNKVKKKQNNKSKSKSNK